MSAILLIGLLAGCGGGGDSTTTTISGAGLNSLGLSPAVSTAFVQVNNNLQVVVQDGPHGFQLAPNANVLYATVTVCVPGGLPSNPNQCQVIDHVQVDTGSVGLRVLASKVASLNLPPVSLSPSQNAWECLPFVIGGLWGPTAGADVWLGQQVATHVAVQLIQDDLAAAVQATSDCASVTNNSILSSADALGSNGILGIGSTNLDCGSDCQSGTYHVRNTDPPGSSVLYYSCPVTATSNATCSLAPMSLAQQVYNPVAALPTGFNNGVVLKMPSVSDPGAASASGELIFGVETQSNNALPGNATKVYLGVDYVNHPDSYLNVNTLYKGQAYVGSYLDTGTNGLFFIDSSTPTCGTSTSPSPWYCPSKTTSVSAVVSNGDNPVLNPVAVSFQIGNAEVMFSTQNTAFADLAGTAGTTTLGAASFAWGMPFFYGRQVFLSLWDITKAQSNPPWYAWSPI